MRSLRRGLLLKSEKGKLWVLLVVGLLIPPLLLVVNYRLSGPGMRLVHWFAELSLTHPGAGEVGVILANYSFVVISELFLLSVALLVARRYGLVERPTLPGSQLARTGIQIGIPYGLTLYFLYWWIGEPNYLTYRGMTGAPSPFGVPLMILIMGLAAVGEEAFFRGFLFRIGKRLMSPLLSGAICIAAFVVWHPQLYLDWHVPRLIGLLSGGALYTILTHRTKSAVPAAWAHVCFNTTQAILANL